MLNFGNCESSVNHLKIVVKENRSSFVVINPQRKNIRRIQVDGCLNINGPRCDFLIIDPSNLEHFVELKGSDINHAIIQLESTIKQISVNSPRCSYVVSTRSPLASPRIQQLQIKFKRTLNSSLVIKSICYELVIS